MIPVLVVIAMLCGLGVLGLAGLLSLAIRRRPAPGAGVAFQRIGSTAAMMARIPSPLFLHPRMDLATGLAPRDQTIDLEQRRTRQRDSDVMRMAVSPMSTTAFRPFGERRRQGQPCRDRLDRLYALDTMGDLSYPVVGAAVRMRPESMPAPPKLLSNG